MDNVFVLEYVHGEYDDHISVPIGVVNDLVSAKLIQEALEAKEPEYMFLLRNMSTDNFCIDIHQLPVLHI